MLPYIGLYRSKFDDVEYANLAKCIQSSTALSANYKFSDAIPTSIAASHEFNQSWQPKFKSIEYPSTIDDGIKSMH